MKIFTRNGVRFNALISHTIDGVQYPAQAFSESAMRAKFGIVETVVPERKDTSFYDVRELDTAPFVVNEPKSAAQIHEMLWGWIKTHRDNLTLNGGCKVGAHWFHSDAYSKLQQLTLKISGIVGTELWKTMSGEFVPLDQAGIEAVVAAQIARDKEIFTVAQGHRLAIEAIADVDQLAAYDWRAGWPAAYEAA